jgi:hypothetical protein
MPVKRSTPYPALRLLQLKMRYMVDAIRQKGEHDAGEEGGSGVTGQRPHQQRGTGARDGEPGQQDKVVDEQRRHTHPVQRRC